ncbi:MAG TPA: SDR family oxidoreductase [Candidatus Baltobacteraceae bacterium]
MRVFVTGASGWIGSAVVPELIHAGHQVSGLARSDSSAAALAAAGVEVYRGSIDDLEVLHEAAAASQGVIHLAFDHSMAFSGNFAGAADADRRAVETIGEALAGSNRPLVVAGGLLGTAPGRAAVETDEPNIAQLGGGPAARLATAQYTRSLASRGVRSVIVRLSPTVHGEGDHGFMARVIAIARETAVSAYIADGTNRWPAVHVLDAARLFRLALESAPAGSTLHGAADEGVQLKAIAEVIGRHLNVPVASISPEEAAGHFTWLAHFLAMDSPASSAFTRELLGWQPTHPGLIDDLNLSHYFQAPAAARY